MIRLKKYFISLVTLALVYTQPLFAVSIDVHFNEISNFIYQLDCVSGALHACSSDNYTRLWHEHFITTEADKENLLAWKNLMNKYHIQANFDDTGAEGTQAFSFIDIPVKIRIASLTAKNLDDYLEKLDLLMNLKDKTLASNITRHFFPKYQPWFEKFAKKSGLSHQKEARTLLKKPEIAKMVRSLVHFYQADIPDHMSLPLHLLFRPELVKESSSGEQIEQFSLVEFMNKTKASQNMDVVIHELSHFFFSTSKISQQTFKNLFVQQKSLNAMGAYNLFNESIASAIGNGIVNKLLMPKETWEKYLSTTGSFYNHPYIDGAAKALLPLVASSLENKNSIHDSNFAPNYVRILQEKYGDELQSPQILLMRMFFIEDPLLKISLNDLRKYFFLSSAHSGLLQENEFIQKVIADPSKSTLLVIHPKSLPMLEKSALISKRDFLKLTKDLRRHKNMATILSRSENAVLYLVIASDFKSAEKGLSQVAAQKKSAPVVFPIN